MKRFRACALGVLCLLPASSARPQHEGEERRADAGWSRQLRLAVRSFDQGRDADAMDRFMEVLVRGDSSERSTANDYLNRIARRMQGGALPAGPPPSAVPGAFERRPGPWWRRSEPAVAAAWPGRASREEGDPDQAPSGGGRAAMEKEIEVALRGKARRYLGELERIEGLRVLMADARSPRAVAIPTDLLFDAGIVFRKEAGRILRAVAGLVYCLGGAQVALLPEGAAGGDSNILDMRRTMGVSAALLAAGIAPPRVRVNILQSQIDLPRGLSDFQGIILLFLYNQPPALRSERAAGEETGPPPVSLGVLPERFSVGRGEGVVIEFSVVEPPAGLSSWRFQILRPGKTRGGDLAVLQEVLGGAPVFHQIYWNGRRNHFGEALPPGRYEVALTATDSRNRARTLRRWITLEGAEPQPETAASAAPEAAAPPLREAEPAPPPAELPGAAPAGRKGPGYVEIVRGAKPVRERRAWSGRVRSGPAPVKPAKGGRAAAKKKGVRLPPAKPAPPPAETPPASQGAVSYKINFARDTRTMTQEGGRRLSQVAETMTYYPLENLNLVGYAGAAETDPEALAEDRAKLVSSLLVNKHNVDSRRIQLQSKVVEMERHEVEIYIVAGKE